MGVCQSHEQVLAIERHKKIEKGIQDDIVGKANVLKLLLLGASESGKTTILKQMRILHHSGFSEEEVQHQKSVVYSNTIESMAAILKAMNTLNIQLHNSERELDTKVILNAMKAGEKGQSSNRMLESLCLFDSVCNSRWFLKTSMILFLNKKDIFAEKVTKHPLTLAFPQYTGPQTYEACAQYIEEQFESLNDNPNKSIYIHQTCATDTNQVQFILDSCIDMIIQQALQGCGLVS